MLCCEMNGTFPVVKVAIGALLCLLVVATRACATETLSTTMTDEKIAKPAVVLRLEAAIKDLQMPSETDAPFEVVFFAVETATDEKPESQPTETEEKIEAEEKIEGGKFSAQKIAELAGAPQDASVETRDLERFFKVATTVEEWMNDEERATAARFAALLKALQAELQEPQVVVWGEAEKRVAIVGKCEGGLAGVTTLIVET